MKIRQLLVTGAAALALASIPVVTSTAGASNVASRTHASMTVHAQAHSHATLVRRSVLGSYQVRKASATVSTGAGFGSRFFSSDGGVLNDTSPKATEPSTAKPPVVSGQATASSGGGSASSIDGLNAYDQATAHNPSYVAEPPDQGLCAGNGYVMEPVNMVMRVYRAGTFAPVSTPIALESFFHVPYAFGVQGGDYSVQGDVRCLYDNTAQRWIVTQLYIDFSAGVSSFMVATSTGPNPLGTYNIYSVDTTDSSNPNCPCFGDQPLLGLNNDAIFISTNEYPIFTGGFNGTQFYVLDKQALYAGFNFPNVVDADLGLGLPTPDNTCCWYSVQPATSPTAQSGTEYALSALDLFNAGDTRIAAWAITNTQSIQLYPNITFSYQVVNSEFYAIPPNATQKAGPIPLGACGADPTMGGCGLNGSPTTLPEGPLATNDDRMNQVVFANGKLWAGLNTAVSVGRRTVQAGIAYFIVTPHVTSGVISGASMSGQGYVAPKGQNVLYPSIGVTAAGRAVIAFSLSGTTNFPSGAYATLGSSGALGQIRIYAPGASPQDGFSEYQDYGTGDWSPRWGDYSAAVADGTTVYFANEMIQSKNCSYKRYLADQTCGGTRDAYANWGTSIGAFRP